jgi:hypothetical protein
MVVKSKGRNGKKYKNGRKYLRTLKIFPKIFLRKMTFHRKFSIFVYQRPSSASPRTLEKSTKTSEMQRNPQNLQKNPQNVQEKFENFEIIRGFPEKRLLVLYDSLLFFLEESYHQEIKTEEIYPVLTPQLYFYGVTPNLPKKVIVSCAYAPLVAYLESIRLSQTKDTLNVVTGKFSEICVFMTERINCFLRLMDINPESVAILMEFPAAPRFFDRGCEKKIIENTMDILKKEGTYKFVLALTTTLASRNILESAGFTANNEIPFSLFQINMDNIISCLFRGL